MRFYIIRHGQTDYNAAHRFQGRMDIPLNDVGKKQAQRNGDRLSELLGQDATEFDFVSSPLGRARHTMEIIRTGLGLAPNAYRIDERLIELSFGDWEGHTLDELQADHPALFAEREANKWTFRPPGYAAESYASLAERVKPFVEEIDKPTVCVCHGGVIRALLHLSGELEGGAAAKEGIPQDQILQIDGRNATWL